MVSLLAVGCHVRQTPWLETARRNAASRQAHQFEAPVRESNAPTSLASASPAAVGPLASRELPVPASTDRVPSPISSGSDARPVASPIVPNEPAPRCAPEMALVERHQGLFCIDRWESSLERVNPYGRREFWPSNVPVDGRELEVIAISVPGRKPQGYISGAQAERACANAKKRLCTIDEWVRACRGPRGTTYPYGNTRQPNLCNDRPVGPSQHPVIRLFERFAPPGTDRSRMWFPEWMNDRRLHELSSTVEPAGSRSGCRNEYGVYDLVGNLHEWVADPNGTFVGGFFMDTIQNGEGCGYRTSAHPNDYHDYSTGFRCCSDALAL